jgi:hypothetical protein
MHLIADHNIEAGRAIVQIKQVIGTGRILQNK